MITDIRHPSPKSLLPKGVTASQELLGLFVYGVVAGVSAAFMHGIFGLVHWQSWPAYLFIGIGMSLTGAGAEQIWHSMVARMLARPHAPRGIVTRVPFWFLAGGMGYVLGMLIAKKLHLIGFYDIPVRLLFFRGGVLGCLLLALMNMIIARKWFYGATNIRQ